MPTFRMSSTQSGAEELLAVGRLGSCLRCCTGGLWRGAVKALGYKQCTDTVERAYSEMSAFLTSPPASVDVETVWKSIIHFLIFPALAEVSS